MWVATEKLPESSFDSLPYASTEDEVLVRETLNGKDGAFAELVRRYEHRLYNFVLRFAGSHHDAEEIVQEAFIKAYIHLEKFRGDSRFATWIYQIAKNLCINHYYQTLRHHEPQTMSLEHGPPSPPVDSEERSFDLPSPLPSPQEQLISREFLSHFETALRKLEPHFRMALILRDVEERDYEEIAKIMGVPIGTVKSRIHRARLEMQKHLEPFLSGEKQSHDALE